MASSGICVHLITFGRHVFIQSAQIITTSSYNLRVLLRFPKFNIKVCIASLRRHVVALRIAILHERSSTPRMLFNSYLFIFVYLPIVFMVFFLIGYRNRILAAGWLACASFIFYAW